MEDLTLLLSVVLLLLLLYVLTHRSSHFDTLIDQIPGPRKYPIIGTILPFIFKKRNETWALLCDVVSVYRPIFRLWIGPMADINLLDAEYFEVVLGGTRHLDKSYPYSFLHGWLGRGLLTSTGQKWHSHRKMITPTFHFKILDNFVEVFAEKSEILVEKLKKEVGSQSFDVYPYITKCALDIICETAMGLQIFAQENGHSDYVTAVNEMSELVVRRLLRPWLHPDLIFKLSPTGRRTQRCLKVLHGFTEKVIKERKAEIAGRRLEETVVYSSEDESVGKKKRKAFLDLLLEASENGEQLTDEELREEVDTFMFEGHDTTSASMCWCIFMLGLHPHIQEKAYEEQESIFQGSERSPTMKDLNEMKYLDRVIKETLRLYPSVPTIGRMASEDIKLGQYTIPRGCGMSLQLYFLHRSPDQFPDPEKFDPDRFLPENTARRHPYAYLPFSAGPRNCIGQKFALLEEKTVLSYILRNYEVKSLDRREDIRILSELVIRPENCIRITVVPRKSL